MLGVQGLRLQQVLVTPSKRTTDELTLMAVLEPYGSANQSLVRRTSGLSNKRIRCCAERLRGEGQIEVTLQSDWPGGDRHETLVYSLTSAGRRDADLLKAIRTPPCLLKRPSLHPHHKGGLLTTSTATSRPRRIERLGVPAFLGVILFGGLPLFAILGLREGPAFLTSAPALFLLACLAASCLAVFVLSCRAGALPGIVRANERHERRVRLVADLGGEDYYERWRNPAIHNSLRDMREQRGLEIAHLALLLDYSEQTVLRLERGLYLPSITTAMMLADLYDTPVEEIFSNTPAQAAP